jgi:hypothetical protein
VKYIWSFDYFLSSISDLVIIDRHQQSNAQRDSCIAEPHADTFFLASAGRLEDRHGGPNGVDISHRGGPAGFVDVNCDGLEVKFPEYRGNNFFMSLGNIAATGAVELLFPHFESGATVTVSGQARCVFPRKRRACRSV